MVISLCIFALICIVVIILLFIELNKATERANTQEQLNEQVRGENAKLAEETNVLANTFAELAMKTAEAEKNLDKLAEQLSGRKEMIEQLQAVYDNTKANQDQVVAERAEVLQKELEARQAQLAQEYENNKQELNTEYLKIAEDLAQVSAEQLAAIQERKNELEDLKAKYLAYVREQLHKEEMLAQQDFFRPVLSGGSVEDIELLRSVQQRLTKKEAIDKIIWSVYYKPSFDILCSHIFDKKDKVCGIYKITSLDTGAAYVGQSRDIKTRFSDHIKAGLDSGPSTNKLYQAMKKYQPCNFLFEILEEVPADKLNEREKYYIDFYCTQEVGMNVTRGGA